jgi:transposase-like protein
MQQNTATLTARQIRLMDALLRGESVSAASQQAGINRSTAIRWMSEEPFKTAYEEAIKETFSVAVKTLQCVTTAATEAMREILTDSASPPAARVSAARAVLEFALKAKEQDEIEQRLAFLEVAYKTK